MTQVIAVSKQGVDVLTETDPNNFIFHSQYNTFKILASGSFSSAVTTGTYTTSFTHNLNKKTGFYGYMYIAGTGFMYLLRELLISGHVVHGDGSISAPGWVLDMYNTLNVLNFSVSVPTNDTIIVRWYIFEIT